MVYDASNNLSLTYIAQMKVEIDKTCKISEKANSSKELDSKCFILLVNKIDSIRTTLNLKQIFEFANDNKFRLVFGGEKMDSEKVLDEIILEYEFKVKIKDLIPKKEAPSQPKSVVSFIFGLSNKSKTVEQNAFIEKDCEVIEKKIFLIKKNFMKSLLNKRRKLEDIMRISSKVMEDHSLKLEIGANQDHYEHLK